MYRLTVSLKCASRTILPYGQPVHRRLGIVCFRIKIPSGASFGRRQTSEIKFPPYVYALRCVLLRCVTFGSFRLQCDPGCAKRTPLQLTKLLSNYQMLVAPYVLTRKRHRDRFSEFFAFRKSQMNLQRSRRPLPFLRSKTRLGHSAYSSLACDPERRAASNLGEC